MNKFLMGLGTFLFGGMRAVGETLATAHDAALDALFGAPVVAGSVGSPRTAAATQVHKVPAAPAAASDLSKVTLQPVDLPDDKMVLRASAPHEGGGDALQVAQRVHVTSVHGPGDHVFGVLWFYIYPDQGIVKRVFKVQDAELRRVLRKDRYFMPPARYDAVAGLDQLRAEALAEVRQLLSHRDASRVKRERTKATPAAPKQEGDAGKGQPVAPAQQPAAVVESSAAARQVKGDVHEGVVTVAKQVPRPGRNGESYDSFCLTINEGTREVPLYGSELERSVREQNIGLGDRVRVIYMGKQPVDIPGKGKAFKNLYQVTRAQQ